MVVFLVKIGLNALMVICSSFLYVSLLKLEESDVDGKKNNFGWLVFHCIRVKHMVLG
jgi:hypothetical protein